VALFLCDDCYEHALDHGDMAWYPSCGAPVEQVLERGMEGIPVDRTALLSWEPMTKAAPELFQRVQQSVRELFRRHQASTVTEAYFGTRWIGNLVSNLRLAPPFASLPSAHGTVVIAASGPRLEEALPVLRRLRGSVALWALPSAVAPLYASGIAPDLVVLTDPGFYAVAHLRPLAAGLDVPVAMPLTAARGVWRYTSRVIPIRQATPFEDIAYSGLGISERSVPEAGTVSATALELALLSGYSSVVFAGLDMCTGHSLLHARPDLLEPYRLAGAAPHRLLPGETVRFRALLGHQRIAPGVYVPRALRTYAEWFRSRSSELHGRVFRLFPSPVEVGLPQIEAADLRRLAQSELPPVPSPVELAEETSPGAARDGARQSAPTAADEQRRRDVAAQRVVQEVQRTMSRALEQQDPDTRWNPLEEWMMRALDLPSALTLTRAGEWQGQNEALRTLRQRASQLDAWLRRYTSDIR
jgi:hypothetical protein